MTDQLEPGCKLQALLPEHLFQFAGGYISCVLCLVRVSFYIDIGLDEEDVVNCAIYSSAIGALREKRDDLLTFVFSPFPIAWCFVVYPRQELESVKWHLGSLDSLLLIELPQSSPSDSLNGCLQFGSRLAGHSQWMGAASVGPHVGEGDFLGRSLLQEQSILRVEEEH